MKSANAVPGPTRAITTPILVLVEGKDEEDLLQRLCKHWFGAQSSCFGFENVDGNSQFSEKFRALKKRSKDKLQVVGVVADSEEDAAATKQKWQDLFKDVVPQINKPCELLQLPDAIQPGAFETLVLEALKGDPVAQCAQAFRDCAAANLADRTQAQKDKIAVQAWLGARLGRAYNNVFKAQEDNEDEPLFDYDHAAFNPVKEFLQHLLSLASEKPHSA
ncbi:hypothetical protein KIK84_02705 [Curvibacter sp. CHRR-16]|uniref:DUF3226 domain-containing protein n=1 Tax=Curvibacter sp. CHRR-16 TaxID=2835872 RepID=UPI001BDAC72B|nr:DUF3226 domain-containing protein [Curvibacter sp. CHRR-16]MBT0569225.1 hypothetical protein [Curvibacter sp. CHRR-16]